MKNTGTPRYPAETIGALAGEAQRDFVIFQGVNNLVGQLAPLMLTVTNGTHTAIPLSAAAEKR